MPQHQLQPQQLAYNFWLDVSPQAKAVLIPLELAHHIQELQPHAHLTLEQILIVKELELLQQLVQQDYAQTQPQQQILTLLVLLSRMDVLQQEPDAQHHWDLVQDIKALQQHAYNILEATVIAQPHQHKLQQLPVLLKYAQMPQQLIHQIPHANHSHSIVSQLVQDAFYQQLAKPPPWSSLVKETQLAHQHRSA